MGEDCFAYRSCLHTGWQTSALATAVFGLIQKVASRVFISRDDLIAAKLASGRPQDLAGVDALRKAV
ncbi:hypothetical protein SBA3_2640012 [Candidatus Sulfopaludibacter sp. SbA3]|nr:hypothetical protein SBA3_2640012 [Candidatus Sulfopaludibacter sp. SbA3]